LEKRRKKEEPLPRLAPPDPISSSVQLERGAAGVVRLSLGLLHRGRRGKPGNRCACGQSRWWRCTRGGIAGGGCWGRDNKVGWVDGDRARAVVSLVDADEAIGQLEHVVAQGDDDELGVAGL